MSIVRSPEKACLDQLYRGANSWLLVHIPALMQKQNMSGTN
jgi:hypothetical protein